MNNYIFNKTIDFNLIQFPIIFPLTYLSILYYVPNSEIYLIFFTIILMAEPHFGATWSIFFNKNNYEYYKSKKEAFYFGTIILIVLCILGFIFFKPLFFLIFYGFNIYHVTRQSIGVCKLYSKNSYEQLFQIYLIYIFNVIFFIIGLFRFYIPLIEDSLIEIVSIIFGSLILMTTLFQYFKYKNIKNALTTLTGMIIFYPICFVDNPVHAILLGVTMHYSQYIVITSKVYFGRINSLENFSKGNLFKLFKSKYFFLIASYGVIMGILSLTGKLENDILKNLIFLPILGQMLHFYLDGFLWRFSEKHNREMTLRYLHTPLK